MTPKSTATRKRQLRQKLRSLRRGLSPHQQAAAGRALRDRLLRHSRYQTSRHIACYLPADGEIDTRPLIHASLAAGKQLYLPVVDGNRVFERAVAEGHAIRDLIELSAGPHPTALLYGYIVKSLVPIVDAALGRRAG